MKDIVVRIGGEGGEGVISCGELLTTALARSNYEVFTFRTYPAEIKGGPAMFQVRSSDEHVLSLETAVRRCIRCYNQRTRQEFANGCVTDAALELKDPRSPIAWGGCKA